MGNRLSYCLEGFRVLIFSMQIYSIFLTWKVFFCFLMIFHPFAGKGREWRVVVVAGEWENI